MNVEKKVINALMESLGPEERNKLARYALAFADEEKVMEKVAKDKDKRIEGLNNIIKVLRPSSNVEDEMRRAIALLRFEEKFRFDHDVEVAGIDTVKITERNFMEKSCTVEISYYCDDGFVDEFYTEVKKGDKLEYTMKR